MGREGRKVRGREREECWVRRVLGGGSGFRQPPFTQGFHTDWRTPASLWTPVVLVSSSWPLCCSPATQPGPQDTPPSFSTAGFLQLHSPWVA